MRRPQSLLQSITALGAFRLAAAIGLLLATGRATHGAADRPTNFVIILVDDLGWTDLTCYGSKYYETPHVDRLARQGMRFTDAYAACAVCSPTRAAVLTGRYPARVGVTDWIRARFQRGGIGTPQQNPTRYVGGPGQKLLCPPNPYWMEHDEVTLAEALAPAGYVSCHIGKWHLGDDDWFPERQGFTFNLGGCDYGQPPNYFDPYVNKRSSRGIPTLKPRKKGEYLTDREADEAVRFITDHRDKPFFLYLAHYAVHTPIQAKKTLIDKYKTKPPTNQKNPVYAAMIESVDDAVGRVMKTLDDLDLAKRTCIIFTSDNGGLMGPTHNAPLRAGKGTPYEGGIRVPLIVRWPAVVQAETVSHAPVTSVDYFPTVLAAASVAMPRDRPVDGKNLIPVLSRRGELDRDALYWHFPHYRGKQGPYSIIRAGDLKLIGRYEESRAELYDLAADLGEQNNLAEERPDVVRALGGKLDNWLQAVRAELPKPNPDYQAASHAVPRIPSPHHGKHYTVWRP